MAWAIRHRPVSPPRSSNRTCGFPASGSPTGFTSRPTVDGQFRLVSRDGTVARDQPSPCGRAPSEAFRSRLVFLGSSPITDPRLLRKRARSQGPFLRRHYPASTVLWPCPTPAQPAADRGVGGATSGWNGPPPITRITFPTCRAHYPGGSERVHASVASQFRAAFPNRQVGRHPQLH